MAPRRQQPQPTSRFASKGAFDVLASEDIQDVSDSASEGSEENVAASSVPTSSANLKDGFSPRMTKTQQKRLAKEAREAKRTRKGAVAADNALPSASDVSAKSSVSSKGAAVGIAEAVSGRSEEAEDSKVQVSTGAVKPTVEIPVQKLALSNAAAASVCQTSSDAKPVETPVSASVSIHGGKPNVSAPAAPVKRAVPVAHSVSPSADVDAEKLAKEQTAYWKKIQERTTFTFLMIFGFFGLLALGHPYMIILVLAIQVLVYREVTALFEIPGRPSIIGGGPRRHVLSRHNSRNGNFPKALKRNADASKLAAKVADSVQVSEDEEDYREEERKELLWSKTLSWYFFTVANYFLYGESLIYYFKHIVFVDSYFIPFARHHRFLSFLLYVIGFVGFVSGLRRENLKHQFGLFGWVHMSLLLIVFSSHFLVNNILEGLIWLFVPASLVICNDVFAYVCGMIWGKTPLISLSPKKTVEGFLGAFIITIVFAFGWSTYFQRFNYLICPAVSLGMNAFQYIHCQVNPVFQWHALALPSSVANVLSAALHTRIVSIPYTPFQFHSLVMAAFASLVAPFGGFFASGFKRAFNIKDFGDSIPGHGGLTDRFDCQFLMGLFSYVYYSSLIREHHTTVGSILQLVVTQLGEKEQVEAYREIGRYLATRGIKA